MLILLEQYKTCANFGGKSFYIVSCLFLCLYQVYMTASVVAAMYYVCLSQVYMTASVVAAMYYVCLYQVYMTASVVAAMYCLSVPGPYDHQCCGSNVLTMRLS